MKCLLSPMHGLTYVCTCTIDDPQLYHGTPVEVQIVGRRLREEKVLAIGKMYENAFREEKS